jgi:sugar phosphate isomerase/epimerase
MNKGRFTHGYRLTGSPVSWVTRQPSASSCENPWGSGWWRYRMPGLGDVDWRGVIDALYEVGYDGTVTVEHEDPIWSGDEARIYSGLEIARRTLQPFLVA